MGQERSFRGCLNALKKKDDSYREDLTLLSPPVSDVKYVQTGHKCIPKRARDKLNITYKLLSFPIKLFELTGCIRRYMYTYLYLYTQINMY